MEIDEIISDDIIRDIRLVYAKHFPKKGDSWKTVPIERLWVKLEEEYDELCIDNVYNELIDLMLTAFMLARRVRDERKKKI